MLKNVLSEKNLNNTSKKPRTGGGSKRDKKKGVKVLGQSLKAKPARKAESKENSATGGKSRVARLTPRGQLERVRDQGAREQGRSQYDFQKYFERVTRSKRQEYERCLRLLHAGALSCFYEEGRRLFLEFVSSALQPKSAISERQKGAQSEWIRPQREIGLYSRR